MNDQQEGSLVLSDLVDGEDLNGERGSQDEELSARSNKVLEARNASSSQPAEQATKVKRGRKPGSTLAVAKKRARLNGHDIQTRQTVRRSSRMARSRTVPQPGAAPKAVVTRQNTKGRGKSGRKPKAARETGSEWEVEKIVGSRIDADSLEHFYEVKWKGFTSKENTWEPKLNLTGCHEAIEEYERRAKLK